MALVLVLVCVGVASDFALRLLLFSSSQLLKVWLWFDISLDKISSGVVFFLPPSSPDGFDALVTSSCLSLVPLLSFESLLKSELLRSGFELGCGALLGLDTVGGVPSFSF